MHSPRITQMIAQQNIAELHRVAAVIGHLAERLGMLQ